MRKLFIGTLILCLIMVVSLSGCGNNNPSPPPFTGDDFNSYPTGVWFLPDNGWQSLLSENWYISAQGVGSSNALYFTPNSMDGLVHAADSSNYTLSVQIKYAATDPGIAPTASTYASIIGRCTDINSYYSATIYNFGGNVWLRIAKYWKTPDQFTHAVSLGSTIWFTGALDVHTWYTISLQCNGSNISATASGGGQTATSVNGADDGVTYGPVLTSGNVGVHSLAAVSFHPFFDNFTVTAL